jgi:hypothetical protein
MMQNILNRIANASKVQIKLNKVSKPLKNRRVAFGLAQDLDAVAAELQNALSGFSVDIASEVSNFNQSVSALENAISQYKTLDIALQNYLEVSSQYDDAAEALGIDTTNGKYDSLINQVANTFDAGDMIIDVEEGANRALRLVDEMPIPFM